MWFKVHRNVNDIRKQIIAFIKKHIIILFTHKSIHNSDKKGIKYRMSYSRWSTSLVVNKQFWSDQSVVDQNETSKRNQLPHDPTTNHGISCAAMVCDPTTQTLINSWTSTDTYTSDLVTAEPEVNIGSSRRGPIMTLSETTSKEEHENGTTYQTPQLGPAP
jgi:hypothetical protein